MATIARQAYTPDEVTALILARHAVVLGPGLLCTRQGVYHQGADGLFSALTYGTQQRCRDDAGHNRQYEDGKWLYC